MCDCAYARRVTDVNLQFANPSHFLCPFSWGRCSVLDIATGEVVRKFSHLLHRRRKIDFIEQFNEKLLVKQVGHPRASKRGLCDTR